MTSASGRPYRLSFAVAALSALGLMALPVWSYADGAGSMFAPDREGSAVSMSHQSSAGGADHAGRGMDGPPPGDGGPGSGEAPPSRGPGGERGFDGPPPGGPRGGPGGGNHPGEY